MSSERYKNRSNLWTFVIYPDDSLPENYLNIIQNWHIPVLLSPVHDADKNADDTEKKKHIHVIIYFGIGSNKSFDQVKVFCDELNGTIPQIVQNRNALIRYFIHLDNPEKHQYNKNDLLCLSGFELGNAFDSFSNDEQIYESIESIIREYHLFNFADLSNILKDNGYLVELSFIRRHTIYFKAILDGNYQKLQNKKK